MMRKNIAIVGTGISGLTAAWLLHKDHDITVFEAGSYVGGHTNTIDVDMGDEQHAVDTGFIVHNERTYPNFIKLLKILDVPVQDTEMSFSVKDEINRLEYNGGSLNKMFAQRRNLFRPGFHRMIGDILRFNKEARELLATENSEITLGDFLNAGGYSTSFRDQYIIPMGAAIWSTVPSDMLKFPAKFFIRFFANHGLLDLKERPQWRTIVGGSREYVRKMIAPFEDRILLNTPVEAIWRFDNGGVKLKTPDGFHSFDEVILATHSDQALAMLADATDKEREILGAIPYQENVAVLHTDESVLPKRKLAWASWNYHIYDSLNSRVALTYNMNILQRLQSKYTFNVTLNREEVIDPDKVIRVITYHHPLFTLNGIAAQERKHEISGVNNTWFCGAYWRNGFHEDGVVSALDVVQGLTKERLQWAA